jgi:hypothetical protein
MKFVSAYNFARRLKTLRGLTPYEFIVKTWTEKPKLFLFNQAIIIWDYTPPRIAGLASGSTTRRTPGAAT